MADKEINEMQEQVVTERRATEMKISGKRLESGSSHIVSYLVAT
jgi:hypothetical protein